MPRGPRHQFGGTICHVLNRANARQQIFHTPADYAAFEKALFEARERVSMRILAYCVIPNHWHLVLWPRENDDLPRFMQWLTTTHTQRWHLFHKTVGTGHLYQGRYKAFPMESNSHFHIVCRYVERNPLRAGLVVRAEHWRHGSLWRRCSESCVGLDEWPISRPEDWLDLVNKPDDQRELTRLRICVERAQPFGSPAWCANLTVRATEHGLPHGVRNLTRQPRPVLRAPPARPPPTVHCRLGS